MRTAGLGAVRCRSGDNCAKMSESNHALKSTAHAARIFASSDIGVCIKVSKCVVW